MLEKESAANWYKELLANHKTGTCKQRVLGIRLIFDSVLLEMLGNIPSKDFYFEAIEQIFKNPLVKNSKKASYIKKEFHQLREFLNKVQHSTIIPNEEGYRLCLNRMANLIKYCSHENIPDELKLLFAIHNNKNAKGKVDASNNPQPSENLNVNQKPELIIIIDSFFLSDSTKDLLDMCLIKHRDEILNATSAFCVVSNKGANLKVTDFRSNQTSILSKEVFLESFNTNQTNVKNCKHLRIFISSCNKHSEDLFTIIKAECKGKDDFFYAVSVSENSNVESNKKEEFDNIVEPSKISVFFEWLITLVESNK